MSDHMQPQQANQDKKETERGQDANIYAAHEKQKSCPTLGRLSSSSCPYMALLSFSFFFPSELPVKLPMFSYSANIFYKRARCLFLITKNHKLYLEVFQDPEDSMVGCWICSCWPFISHKNVGAQDIKQLLKVTQKTASRFGCEILAWFSFFGILILSSTLQLSSTS